MKESAILRDATAEQLEAFVQVVVLVAYADGDLSSTEEKVLVERVQTLAEGRVDDEHMQQLMQELPPLSRATNNWRKERISRLRKELEREDLRQEAFSLAVEVANSEGGIGLREGRMLVNIVSELEIDGKFAQEVLKRQGI